MNKARKLLSLLIASLLSLLPLYALADDCFLIDVDSLDTASFGSSAYVEQYLTAQTQGVRVCKYISDSNELAANVRLTIEQTETSTVIFDKNYGYIGGTFDSGDIYLPYVDNNVIPYQITLSIADTSYVIPFMHQQPRLSDNSACTFGVRLKDYNASLSGGWMMGTMLNLDALRSQGSTSIPICASNLYVVGQATVTVAGDTLTVSLSFTQSADVQVSSSAVYLIGDVSTLSGVPSSGAHSVGQDISISGLRSALLYVPMKISYNSTGLTEFSYDTSSATLNEQLALWSANRQGQ